MTARLVPRRDHRCLSRRVPRLVGPALVTLALLAVPVPDAVAQAAPRPEPTELWRQFPLNTERSNPVAPADGARTSPASGPRTGSTAERGRGRRLSTFQLAAIVLTMALALILTTGVLAYAQRGRLGLATKRRRRRFNRWSIRDFVDALRADRRARLRVGPAHATLRRAKRTAAGEVHAMRARAASLHAQIVSEVSTLKERVAARTVPTNHEAEANDDVGNLKDRVDLYLDPAKRMSTAHTKFEAVYAESDPRLAPARSPADDELEVLKAKLGKSAAPVGDHRADEVETLKAKLGRDAFTGESEMTTRNLLKRKLAERRAPLKAGLREVDNVASLKAKLEVPNGPAKDAAGAAVEVDTRDTSAGKPETGRATDLAPLAQSPASAASPRSTAPSARPSNRTQLGAVAPVELLRSSSRMPEWPLGPEPLWLDDLLATKCRIFWWHGYLKSVFYAVARSSAGDEYLVAESPHFRWNKEDPPPPQNARATDAHHSLLEALERDGWSVAATGEHWFTLELERKWARGRPEPPAGERG
jgi:hypothetical protein